MMMMAMGAKSRMQKKSGRRKMLTLVAPWLVSSLSTNFLSPYHPTNQAKNTPPSGSKMLLDTKSNKSKIVLPKMVKSLSTLNDSAHSVPKAMPMPVYNKVAFLPLN